MNKLLLIAVDNFKADIIVPLDRDQFLISSERKPTKNIKQYRISKL